MSRTSETRPFALVRASMPLLYSMVTRHGTLANSVRAESVAIVVNQQVRPEVRKHPFGGLRDRDPNFAPGALAPDRERYSLAIHLGRDRYQHTHHALRFIP